MSTLPALSLSDTEALLRKCLLDCRDQFFPESEVRITGGWVRDKLIGVPSVDIDVALSTTTGLPFAEKLSVFLPGSKYLGEAQRMGVSIDLGSLHKIAANPEKSKHLETTTTKLFDLDLDFVNLRKETYTDDSRNPQMEFGTAEEDALRRDCTINALFLNLDTLQVEDFTGRGLQDMKDKIIRTPLQPYQTYKDDPLRVLRLIRFACRLGFEIEAKTQEAMKGNTIHEALRLKISRERVWTEVGKMFTGPDPCRACLLIHELGLSTSVFADPLDPTQQHSTSPAVYKALQRLIAQHPKLSAQLRIEENRELSWILASYTSYGINGDEKVARRTLLNALKPAGKLLDVFTSSVKNHNAIKEHVLTVVEGFDDRGQLGMLLYNLGPTWPSQVLYSLLCELEEGVFDQDMQKYESFLEKLESQDLLQAAQAKPVINGGEIQKALGATRSGPWMSTAVKTVLEWQFANPGAGKDEAIQMISGRPSKDKLREKGFEG